MGWVGSALGEGRGALNPEAQARPAVLGAAAAAAAGPPVLVISGNHLRGREACFSCGTNSHLHVPSGAKFAPNESLGQKLRRSPSHLPGGGGGSGPASPGSGLRDLHREAPSPPPAQRWPPGQGWTPRPPADEDKDSGWLGLRPGSKELWPHCALGQRGCGTRGPGWAVGGWQRDPCLPLGPLTVIRGEHE